DEQDVAVQEAMGRGAQDRFDQGVDYGVHNPGAQSLVPPVGSIRGAKLGDSHLLYSFMLSFPPDGDLRHVQSAPPAGAVRLHLAHAATTSHRHCTATAPEAGARNHPGLQVDYEPG